MLLKWHPHSVSNSSGPSLRVRGRVEIEPLPDVWSRWSLKPNRQCGDCLMEISQPVWFVRIVSRSPSGSICRFIQSSCFCCLIILSYQNLVLNSRWSLFACFAVRNIDCFGMHVSSFICCVFAYKRSQKFCNELICPHAAYCTHTGRLDNGDAAWTLQFMIG